MITTVSSSSLSGQALNSPARLISKDRCVRCSRESVAFWAHQHP